MLETEVNAAGPERGRQYRRTSLTVESYYRHIISLGPTLRQIDSPVKTGPISNRLNSPLRLRVDINLSITWIVAYV